MIDRHQPAVGLDQLEEDVLQDVFDVLGVGHAPADEVPQPGPFPLDDADDAIGPFHDAVTRSFVL